MKQLWKWELVGFIFVGILGVLLHFAYEWLGGGRLIALFSAVNESTWEHLKLVFVPEVIFSIVSYYYLKNDYSGLLWVRVKGIIRGMIWIVVAFYVYTGILGKGISWINIALFFVGIAITGKYVLQHQKEAREKDNVALAVVVVAILSILFMIFTFNPPNIGLFQEPMIGE